VVCSHDEDFSWFFEICMVREMTYLHQVYRNFFACNKTEKLCNMEIGQEISVAPKPRPGNGDGNLM